MRVFLFNFRLSRLSRILLINIVSVFFSINFHLRKNQELHITKGIFRGDYACFVYLKTSSGEGLIADFYTCATVRNTTEFFNLMISGKDDLEFKVTSNHLVATSFTGFLSKTVKSVKGKVIFTALSLKSINDELV